MGPFNPVLVNGILKSNTRLRHADDLPYGVKCPVILPKRNHATRLIIKYYHELEGHQMGLNYTINHVREKYLVVHVRKQVKRAIMRECFARDDFDQSQLTSKWRRYPRLDCSKPPDLSRAVQLTSEDLS